MKYLTLLVLVFTSFFSYAEQRADESKYIIFNLEEVEIPELASDFPMEYIYANFEQSNEESDYTHSDYNFCSPSIFYSKTKTIDSNKFSELKDKYKYQGNSDYSDYLLVANQHCSELRQEFYNYFIGYISGKYDYTYRTEVQSNFVSNTEISIHISNFSFIFKPQVIAMEGQLFMGDNDTTNDETIALVNIQWLTFDQLTKYYFASKSVALSFYYDVKNEYNGFL